MIEKEVADAEDNADPKWDVIPEVDPTVDSNCDSRPAATDGWR